MKNRRAYPIYFIGIDLAFSPRNNTGVVILAAEDDTSGSNPNYVASRLCKSDEEISDFVMPYLVPGRSVVAVDAPLVVPNDSGMRICERLVAQKYGAKQCSAYPAHRGNMAGTRGPVLLQHLQNRGVSIYTGPQMPKGWPYAHCFETYPHAAHLAMFNLPRVWKYKKKSGRSWDSCRNELVSYWRELLTVLPRIDQQILSFTDGDPLGTRLLPWLPSVQEDGDPPGVVGTAYKEFEDLTDGLFCAYAASHIHFGKPALLFCPDSPGENDLSKYKQGQGFIVVPAE